MIKACKRISPTVNAPNANEIMPMPCVSGYGSGYGFRKGSILIVAMSILLMSACSLSKKKSSRLEPTHACASTETFYEAQAPLYSFDEDQDLEQTIQHCVYAKERFCSMDTLSLLGQGRSKLTIADILERTVVSDAWMKARFKEVLHSYPDELIQMFRYVTAVVIADQARPSHYWAAHGMIVLDPAYLWLTNEEKNSLNTNEDCRLANFRKADVGFRVVGLLAKEGVLLGQRNGRNLGFVSEALAQLLMHELAHAVDFTSHATKDLALVNPTMQVWEYVDSQDKTLSDQLEDEGIGLHSAASIIREAAAFFYAGSTPSDALKNATPSEIGKAIEQGGMMNLYSYHNQREDFANLIEAHLSRKYLGISHHLAVIEYQEDAKDCSDSILAWGHHHRDLSDLVLRRTSQVLTLGKFALHSQTNESKREQDTPKIFETNDLCSFIDLKSN